MDVPVRIAWDVIASAPGEVHADRFDLRVDDLAEDLDLPVQVLESAGLIGWIGTQVVVQPDAVSGCHEPSEDGAVSPDRQD